MRRHPVALTFMALAPGATLATAEARADDVFVVDAALGPALLMKTASKTVPHALRPALRLGVRRPLHERVEIGGAITGLLAADQHYRVFGGVAHARLAAWQAETWSLGAGLAIGIGRDADILHGDLDAQGAVRPYGFGALDARWRLGAAWSVGVEAAWENLAIARAGFLVGWGFADRRQQGSTQ